jgi:hypothetical protein
MAECSGARMIGDVPPRLGRVQCVPARLEVDFGVPRGPGTAWRHAGCQDGMLVLRVLRIQERTLIDDEAGGSGGPH